MLDAMALQYGCAPDEFSYAALCVAVQQSDLAGSEAVAEAARIEAAIEASGEPARAAVVVYVQPVVEPQFPVRAQQLPGLA